MDIFNSAKTNVQSWSAAGAVLTWGRGNGSTASTLPFLATGVNWSFGRTGTQQNVLNTDANGNRIKITIYGDASGSLTINSLLSPSAKQVSEFLEAIQNPCVTPETSVSVRIEPYAGFQCSNGDITGKPVFDMYGVTLNQLGGGLNAGVAAQITMDLTMSITGLKIQFGA